MQRALQSEEGRSNLLPAMIKAKGDLGSFVLSFSAAKSKSTDARNDEEYMTRRQLLNKYGSEQVVDQIVAQKVRDGQTIPDVDNPGSLLYMVSSRKLKRSHKEMETLQAEVNLEAPSEQAADLMGFNQPLQFPAAPALPAAKGKAKAKAKTTAAAPGTPGTEAVQARPTRT